MNRGKFVLADAVSVVNGMVRRPNAPTLGTRVMMYHDVNEDNRADDIYSVPLTSFSRGVSAVAAWAKEHRHRFVTFSAACTPGIAVTFDDGYSSTLRLAAPVFANHAIPFHVFVTKAYVESGNPLYLSPRDVRELAAFPGATVGLHGASHTKFSQLDDASLRRELEESRDWLQQLTGRSIDTLSYPHGDFSPRVGAVVAQCGITAAACSNVGTYSDSAQSLSIPRVDLWSHDSPRTTVAKVRGDWDLLLRFAAN